MDATFVFLSRHEYSTILSISQVVFGKVIDGMDIVREIGQFFLVI